MYNVRIVNELGFIFETKVNKEDTSFVILKKALYKIFNCGGSIYSVDILEFANDYAIVSINGGRPMQLKYNINYVEE